MLSVIILKFCRYYGVGFTSLAKESRSTCFIFGALNSTFITPIANVSGPIYFKDYRPISLCNTVNKIISKIIANRLKVTLSKHIASEQFGFLKNCQIWDVVDTSQECLHFIKTKKTYALLLKLDIHKAHDCAYREFMRLVLHEIGLSRLVI